MKWNFYFKERISDVNVLAFFFFFFLLEDSLQLLYLPRHTTVYCVGDAGY